MDKQHRDNHRHAWRLWHVRSPAPSRQHDAADTLTRLGTLGDLYLAGLTNTRELSVEIEEQVEIAKEAGNSLTEISRASGLSATQIEYIVVSVHVQQQFTDHRHRAEATPRLAQ